MSKKEITITAEEWLNSLEVIKQRPENSFTIEEVMNITNKKRAYCTQLLNDKTKQGELLKGKFRENGTIRNYYTPNPNFKKK